MISLLAVLPIFLIIVIVLCWFISRSLQPLQAILLGIQFTILGIFILLLGKFAFNDSDFMITFAIFFSIFGTVLSVVHIFKKL